MNDNFIKKNSVLYAFNIIPFEKIPFKKMFILIKFEYYQI